LCFYYTADTDNVPPFATVTLYLVPSGDFNIKPLDEVSTSTSPCLTSNPAELNSEIVPLVPVENVYFLPAVTLNPKPPVSV